MVIGHRTVRIFWHIGAVLLVLVVMNPYVGWTLKHIGGMFWSYDRAVFSTYWHTLKTPFSGEEVLPEAVKEAKAALLALGIQEYRIDASFYINQSLGPDLLRQRLIEGAWPRRPTRASPNVVFSGGIGSGELAKLGCSFLATGKGVTIAVCHP